MSYKKSLLISGSWLSYFNGMSQRWFLFQWFMLLSIWLHRYVCFSFENRINRLNDYHQGRLCDSPINSCAINPCQNNGLCLPTSTGYQCQCSSSYTGSLCQTALNPCGYSPCQNGGQCNPTVNNSFYCTCPAGIFTKRKNKNCLFVLIFSRLYGSVL